MQVRAALKRILHDVQPVPPPRRLPRRPDEADNEAFDRGNAAASPPLYYEAGRYAELAGAYAEAVEQVRVARLPPPEDPNAKKKGESHLGGVLTGCRTSLLLFHTFNTPLPYWHL